MKVPRIGRILSANAAGQTITIAISLVSVPVFLSKWDQNTYGVWLLLYTIPAYLANADFGIGTTTINRILIEREDSGGVSPESIFSSSNALIYLVILSILLITLVSSFVAHIFLKIEHDIVVAAVLLSGFSSASLLSPLIEAQYKHTGRYAQPILFLNLQRLMDWLFGIGFFLISATFISTALGFFLSRVFTTAILIGSTLMLPERLPWRASLSDKSEIKRTLSHSGFFSLFPVSNLFLLQGSLSVIGFFLGPGFVAIFSTYRTLVRASTQLLALVNKSFWPEFSEAFGKRDIKRVESLRSICKKLNLVLGFFSVLFLATFGQKILEYWTHNEIYYRQELLFALLTGVLLTSAWQSDWVLTMATNQHKLISVLFFFSALLSIATLFLLLSLGVSSSISISIFVIGSEVLLLIASRYSAKKLFD